MQEHEIAPPAPREPEVQPPTPTQALVQRLTASVQAETTLGIAQRLDALIGEHEGDETSIEINDLAEFYRLLVREGQALRAVASG